jgi:hypothetical protein
MTVTCSLTNQFLSSGCTDRLTVNASTVQWVSRTSGDGGSGDSWGYDDTSFPVVISIIVGVFALCFVSLFVWLNVQRARRSAKRMGSTPMQMRQSTKKREADRRPSLFDKGDYRTPPRTVSV